MKSLAGIISFAFLMWAAFASAALGQSTPVWEPELDDAVRTIEAGAPRQALASLETIFEATPAAYSRKHFSVAYWLGRAYLLDGRPDDAREVWRRGIQALDEAGLFDPRLGIQFVRTAYEAPWEQDRTFAGEVYLRLLYDLAFPLPEDVRQQLASYLEGLALVIPELQRKAFELPAMGEVWVEPLAPETPGKLVSWWRSQDPAPATRANEMLEEHLERVTYAILHYRGETGDFDDRGAVYIRLGPPSRTTSIQFDKSGFRTKVLDRNLTLNESDFPENEFWFYEHIDDAAQYIFYDDNGAFRTGEVRHLLPASLRSGLGSSERGQQKARALVRTLEEIYRQLSLYHQDYATRYQEVAAFASLLDEAEIAAESASAFQQEEDDVQAEEDPLKRDLLANNRGPDFSSVGLPGSSFNPSRPDLFVQSIMMNDKASDEMIAAHREAYVPTMRSNAFDETAPLPLFVRSARFLDKDGATRTEIYWAAPSGALELGGSAQARIESQGFEAKDYLLVTSVVQKSPGFADREVHHYRTLIPDIGTGAEATIPTQTIVVRGDTGLYHIALEWDQYAAALNPQGQLQSTGPRIKAHVFRQDSLQALRSDESALEVSDIRPMALPPGVDPETMADRFSDIEGVIYPAPGIRSDMPLFLYFEIYHLMYGSDDQTRYTIAYEIERRNKGGLLRRGDTERTSFSSSQQSRERTARERLLLDLREMEGAGEIDIRLIVTDEVSGRQVSRLISFLID